MKYKFMHFFLKGTIMKYKLIHFFLPGSLKAQDRPLSCGILSPRILAGPLSKFRALGIRV